LDSGLFNNLVNIEEINLGFNLLISSGITNQTFMGLKNLGVLSINNNELVYIRKDMFSDLVNLTNFDLSSNQIRDVDPSSFSLMSNLGFLNLSSNQIANLDRNVLVGLTNLIEVDFSGNLICMTQPDFVKALCDSDPDCYVKC
jgi:Leucine-rich repeat (LRR) protein